jgi:hypothetical protein
LSPILGIIASQDYVRIPPGAYESIATFTPSGSTSITFSSIPSTYSHLQIRVMSRTFNGSSGGDGALRLRINGLSTSIYDRHNLSGNSSSASAGSDINSTEFSLDAMSTGDLTAAGIFGVGIIDIIDYASTTKNKTLRWINGANANGSGNEIIRLQSGLWRNTGAINSLNFFDATANGFASGTVFSLYGIKGA